MMLWYLDGVWRMKRCFGSCVCMCMCLCFVLWWWTALANTSTNTPPNRMSLGQGWVLVGFKGFHPGIRISGVFTSGKDRGKKIKMNEIKPS